MASAVQEEQEGEAQQQQQQPSPAEPQRQPVEEGEQEKPSSSGAPSRLRGAVKWFNATKVRGQVARKDPPDAILICPAPRTGAPAPPLPPAKR